MRSLIIAVCVICFARIPALCLADNWKEMGGDHFVIRYGQDDKFAKNVLEKAEVYYKQIASDLGYPRYSEFWTWDRRVKIYIYPDHASFIKATGEPAWVQGMADYVKKEIISYAWSSGFVESLLPHEMAHLIFRDFVGFKGEIPTWLDEGVAQWEEESRRREIRATAKMLYLREGLLSLDDMMKIDLKDIKEEAAIFVRKTRARDNTDATLILSGKNLIGTYYAQAASLVGFLIERFGSDNFAQFCRELRDGKSLEDALRFAYPTHTRSLRDLEDTWRKYLEDMNID